MAEYDETVPDTRRPTADELLGLARNIESESVIASRPGQLGRLEAIANRLRAMAGLERERAARAAASPPRDTVQAEVDRLRAALDDALEGLQEMRNWVPPRATEFDGYIIRAKIALGES